MEYVLASLDMFAGIGENLIAYAFNVSLTLFLEALLSEIAGIVDDFV
jgi:hypothetical protein